MNTRKIPSFIRFLNRMLVACLVLSFAFVFPAVGQSRKDLEKKKTQLRKDIEATNSQLKKTRKSKSNSLNQLVTINKKIGIRTELIHTINSEITTVDGQIDHVSVKIDSLQGRLGELKRSYAETIVAAYKNRNSMSKLYFILASDNLNQAFKRMRYLRELADHRARQQQAILSTKQTLNGKQRELHEIKSEKSELLASEQEEKKRLDKEKREQVSLLNDLTTKEKQLRADLKKKQQKEQQLSARIEEIIRKEIAAAQAATQAKSSKKKTASTTPVSSKKPAKPTNYILATTPEAVKLSNDFEGNRGKLPWPVEQGVITGSFGQHAHPVWRDVTVNNNGVNIATAKGAKARAVFSGKVVRVLMVVDKYAVLVQHGEYFTLYSNLENVLVKAGDQLTTKQLIGTITSGDQEGKGEVHLEIWRGSTKMDPQSWLASR
ncbi:MAG: murein hydrolase activator EnvC family protein [Bacteroidota bacterium]